MNSRGELPSLRSLRLVLVIAAIGEVALVVFLIKAGAAVAVAIGPLASVPILIGCWWLVGYAGDHMPGTYAYYSKHGYWRPEDVTDAPELTPDVRNGELET